MKLKLLVPSSSTVHQGLCAPPTEINDRIQTRCRLLSHREQSVICVCGVRNNETPIQQLDVSGRNRRTTSVKILNASFLSLSLSRPFSLPTVSIIYSVCVCVYACMYFTTCGQVHKTQTSTTKSKVLYCATHFFSPFRVQVPFFILSFPFSSVCLNDELQNGVK